MAKRGRPSRRKPKLEGDERPVVKTQREAAALLGVSQPTVGTWAKQPGFPARRGGYDVAAILEWRERSGDGGTESQFDFLKERAREKKYHADLRQVAAERARMELQVAAGKLLPREAWERHMATVLTHLADAAEQLPDFIAQESCPKCREKIRRQLRHDLDAWRNETADELARGPRDE